MIEIHYRTTCRVCRGPLEPTLRLGELKLNAFPADLQEIPDITTVPHTLAVCVRCGLAQLMHTVPPDWMYKHYYYLSGVNETMVKELRSVVGHARSLVSIHKTDHVLDIGANDGTLLAQWTTTGGEVPIRFAVEPAENLQVRLQESADVIVGKYFPCDVLDPLVGRFKVITAIAMCYDLEDPISFFTKIRQLLHPEGVCIVQFQDMGQMLATAAFDNICPEHLEYYTLGTLNHVLGQADLTAVDCRQTPINGGSLRVVLRPSETVAKYGRSLAVFPSINRQLVEEERLGLEPVHIAKGNLDAYEQFTYRVHRAQEQIEATIQGTLAQGVVPDVYGASTKGNVLLQVMGLGPKEIRCAIDRSAEKHGRYTVTGIPIVSEEAGAVAPAPVWLCPIWQFRTSVLARNQWYLRRGGKIIFPLPAVEIVQGSWEA